ncbi:I78 family peptidase inhibitor [Pseudomonas sp. Marseille-QA0892]
MPARANALIIVAMATFATACSTTDAPSSSSASPASSSTSSTVPADGRCDSTAAQAFAGKPISEALVEQAQRTTGAGNVRVLRPGDAMTMDYDSTRLNLDTDAAGVAQRASCG